MDREDLSEKNSTRDQETTERGGKVKWGSFAAIVIVCLLEILRSIEKSGMDMQILEY